jgi:hypothetical protein
MIDGARLRVEAAAGLQGASSVILLECLGSRVGGRGSRVEGRGYMV